MAEMLGIFALSIWFRILVGRLFQEAQLKMPIHPSPMTPEIPKRGRAPKPGTPDGFG